LLSFGIPLIPHFIGGWVMTMVARLYLNSLATVADTGLYSVGFNIASPIALLVGAANQAYVPALFSVLSNQETLNKLRLARILLVGAALLPVLAICYGVAVALFVPLLVGPRFYGASEYVLWLGLGFAIQGIYFIFGNFVVYSKRTSLMSWRADFLGGIVMMIACPILIQINGPLGAAQATALAFTVSCIGCFAASRIAFPMPWKEAFLSLAKPWRVSGFRNGPLAVTKRGIDT
jgi:O-antigen/teichoic acid export membrane protein